jgi:hypothetical protein
MPRERSAQTTCKEDEPRVLQLQTKIPKETKRLTIPTEANASSCFKREKKLLKIQAYLASESAVRPQPPPASPSPEPPSSPLPSFPLPGSPSASFSLTPPRPCSKQAPVAASPPDGAPEGNQPVTGRSRIWSCTRGGCRPCWRSPRLPAGGGRAGWQRPRRPMGRRTASGLGTELQRGRVLGFRSKDLEEEGAPEDKA